MTNTKNKEVKCVVCGKTWYTWGSNKEIKYCSETCVNEVRYREFIEKWINHEVNGSGKSSKLSAYVVRYIFEKRNNKCEQCGFDTAHPRTGNSILQIHHSDENPENSSVENLKLLCPNCHALADSKNTAKGNGRRYYRKQYHKNKR